MVRKFLRNRSEEKIWFHKFSLGLFILIFAAIIIAGVSYTPSQKVQLSPNSCFVASTFSFNNAEECIQSASHAYENCVRCCHSRLEECKQSGTPLEECLQESRTCENGKSSTDQLSQGNCVGDHIALVRDCYSRFPKS